MPPAAKGKKMKEEASSLPLIRQNLEFIRANLGRSGEFAGLLNTIEARANRVDSTTNFIDPRVIQLEGLVKLITEDACFADSNIKERIKQLKNSKGLNRISLERLEAVQLRAEHKLHKAQSAKMKQYVDNYIADLKFKVESDFSGYNVLKFDNNVLKLENFKLNEKIKELSNNE